MPTPPRSVLCACLIALPPGAAVAADDLAPIVPYRPTVSNPAQLPAPGQLEVEFGGVHERRDDGHRNALPYLLKLAFTPEWGVLIGGDLHVWQHDSDGRASSIGDTALTAKRAWRVDDATAFGAELTATIPTADRRIGAGRADYALNAIASRDLGPLHVDVNLNATRLGAPDEGTGRAKIGASASLSAPVAGQWNLTGELSGSRQAGERGAQVLAALTYSPSNRLTIDIGVARAWRPVPAGTQIFAGAVFPIAKLW